MHNKNFKGKIVTIKLIKGVIRDEWEMKEMKKKKRINEDCPITDNERV